MRTHTEKPGIAPEAPPTTHDGHDARVSGMVVHIAPLQAIALDELLRPRQHALRQGADGLARGAKRDRAVADNPEPFLAEVGARIRSARTRLKLKQSDLARAISSESSTYIVAIEAGEANITLRTLLKVAEALSIPPRDLLPVDHAEQVTKLLDATAEDLDRAAASLRQARTLVTPPSTSVRTRVSAKS
jgi:transcriptional regulator with XRE-family HTH domain